MSYNGRAIRGLLVEDDSRTRELLAKIDEIRRTHQGGLESLCANIRGDKIGEQKLSFEVNLVKSYLSNKEGSPKEMKDELLLMLSRISIRFLAGW